MFFRPEVNLEKYTGCLKDIEISRTPYNILSSPDFVGLTKGCTLEVSLISIILALMFIKVFWFLILWRSRLIVMVYSLDRNLTLKSKQLHLRERKMNRSDQQVDQFFRS